MSRRRATVGEQLALDVTGGNAPAGRVERSVASALKAAHSAGDVDLRLDAGLATLARELGRAVDVAGVKRDAYAVATASRELREVLARLRLDPTSRRGTDTEQAALAELLAKLSTPSTPTPA